MTPTLHSVEKVDRMDYWMIAILIKPFVLFLLTLFVLYPIRRLIEIKMRPGKLKSLLLRRTN